MLTQSKEVQNAWRASQRTLDIKVTIDGKTYGATDINSLKYDSGAYNGDTFAIGSTYSNTVQIEFSHLVEGLKLGMEVRPSIGIKTSSGYIYEPLGVFIISSEIKMDRNNNLTTVSASDRFCGLEGGYVSKLTYPAKVLDVIAEICAQSGVKANTNDLARLPHQEDLPAPITGQSYRKALGWIAQLYVGYALFDRQGLFTIRTISEPNYELDPSQYEQAGLTKNEAAYKINGIQCQVTLTTKTRDGESTEETKTYQAGDATGSQIKLENNIMTPKRLNDIWEQLKDLTFYPFSLNWFGNPAVEAGDWLRLEDKQRNSFVVPNSSYTLDFNGGLSATSKADQTTSSDQMVPWQGSVIQTIKELQLRRSPDGTVIFPPSVIEPPQNAKFNDVWFKKNGNATELWVFEKQSDGSGKWVRKDLSDGEIRKIVDQAQSGLIEAKQQIEANKELADQSLSKLDDSVTKLQNQYDNNIVPDLTKVTNDVSDALQKYISAQNNIADLTKQAQAQGKNIADITKTVDGLNINYANLLGDVNSTKIDVKGLQTTLGTANGDINQLKIDAQHMQSLLAGKVDNSTYTNFVNLTNQALAAKLTASDLNGYAKTVDVEATANGLKVDMNSVTDRLNNLKIGVTNLIQDGDANAYGATPWDNTIFQNHDFYYNAHRLMFNLHTASKNELISGSNWFLIEAGKQYVLTFKGFMSANVSSYDVWLLGKKAGTVGDYTDTYSIISGERLSAAHTDSVSKIFTIPSFWDNYEAYIRFDNNGSTDGQDSVFFFNEVSLKEGNVNTGYGPNFEDTNRNLTELSSRITANTQQFSSYYTKLETDNRANSAKNDAINSIKNDGNWQGLSNILTNSGFLQNADGFLQKVQQTTIPMFNGGGVNLVSGTAEDIVVDDTGNTGTQGWCFKTIPINADLKVGDKITVSAESVTITGRGDLSKWGATLYSKDISEMRANNYEVNAGNNTKVTITVTSMNDASKQTALLIYSGRVSDTEGKKAVFHHLKVERGEIATPYSQAPYDNTIAFTELSQSLKGLRSTVSGNYGQLQNTISQTNQATRNEITDKVNGLQSQITANANSFNVSLSNIQRSANVQVVNNAINANDYTATGTYFIKSASNVNVPASIWCYLEVKKADDSRITQIWRADNDPNLIYTRTYNGWWSDWQRTVTGGNIMAQINMSASTTLIQNDKIYMDASSTVFSGNAFIPSAAITSLNADKITTGTLNAANVNIINLNANNITAGTLTGSNGEFYLDSGALHVWQNNHDAWIDQNGIHDYDNSGNNVWIKKGGISAYGNTSSIDIRDGEIHLNKKMGISDGVLASDYGNIKKVDNILQFGTSGLDITGTDGFILKTNGWDNSVINRMSGEPINGSGMAGNKAGYMQLGAGRQIILYAGSPVSDGKAKEMPRLVLGGALTNGESELNGWFSSYRFTSPNGSINGGFTLGQNSVLLNSFDGKSGLFTDSNSATLTAGDKYISVGGIWPGVKGDFNVSGNFTVSGSKNAIVPTSRGMAAINAYETAEYYFGDIGETQTNDDGVVTVMIDPYFLETVNTLVPYKVFLTSYGDGNVWVSSRSANNFTVKSSNPNIHFAWEIKAKRKGYENDRMKIVKGVFNNEQY
ncbi:MAG: pyocin knob domain-containing protein [Limosilactobacillus sp.]|uniref:pyocin knob domain-containing protein n=1 Tax=Limosilactobacillus sp. TaxID=2773925 RepID=UPI0023BC9799|nr:pyocin knob domain-containing protein [Limosilactobacillus sp.]MDE7040715.1 pyocin knob domain-containing protein [Limosilactobacillus sp.]